ncbi:MAG TPA: calcineurin-like phosphoesterase family protein [Oligoflexus sp.]|uniref:calcineurin-like phosphoesterase family protein n=1 Tax=Oligoflexus sp. TaxID=1971216 RepID=UPI002D4A50A0|nr:calcineurin-like phosphoesterase family protein [Oligoflexus sp.]HYX36242.1 calcineurin-like phosphoesterase family protein [Oligoflexus sp.]
MNLRKHLLSTLAWALLPATLSAQDKVSGYVFHDVNADGKKQPTEEGLAGVLVSNGLEVTPTDAEGKYKLSIRDDMIIHVIKPSGWKLPGNDVLPKFYFVHKPSGSPQLKYRGVAPTGPLPASLDFPLLPSEEPRSFSALVFGDPQPNSLQDVAFFEKDIIEQIPNPEQYAFGISLGDIVNDNLDLYPAITAATGRLKLPWFHVYGNHDMNYDARNFATLSADEKDHLADETWERVFGPANYAFSYSGATFVNLDDVYYPTASGGYIGGLREDQKIWFTNLLAQLDKEKFLVVSMHIPLFDSWRAADLQFFLKALSPFKKVLTMSAHSHMQQSYFFRKEDGRGWEGLTPHHHFNAGTTSGSWWGGKFDSEGVPETTMRDGTPNGYAVLSIQDDQYRIEFHPTRYEGNSKGILYVKPDLTASRMLNVKANLFNLSEQARVSMRFVDQNGTTGRWLPMRFAPQFDPMYVEKYDFMLAHPKTGRNLPAPANSYHFWEGDLSDNVGSTKVGGTVQIKAEDFFCESFEMSYDLR